MSEQQHEQWTVSRLLLPPGFWSNVGRLVAQAAGWHHIFIRAELQQDADGLRALQVLSSKDNKVLGWVCMPAETTRTTVLGVHFLTPGGTRAGDEWLVQIGQTAGTSLELLELKAAIVRADVPSWELMQVMEAQDEQTPKI